MIFAGNQERGYFSEEFAGKNGLDFAYVGTYPHIADQTNDILRHGKQDYTIFDVDTYIDDADEIADQIIRICRANNSKAIVYAPGYMLESAMIMALYDKGITYFITAQTLSSMKDQLEKCINGYYDANGIEEFKVVQREENLEEEKKNLNIKLIGVAGACNRIGTTTHAMQIIRYLQLKGYKACYIQMNSTKYVSNMLEWFNVESQDEEIGRITYSGIDHFYNVNKIQDVLRLGYDYYVYDYGVNCDVNFNRVSFMEKDIKIFVVGADPTEIPYTYEIVKSAFYDDVKYIFNFAAKTDADDLKELMGDKYGSSFIAEFIPDKYVYVPTEIYEKIIPVTDLSVEQNKTKKRKGFFGKKRK